jgi:hypothetical protein
MAMLANFDPDQYVIIQMDTSKYVSTSILWRYDDDNVLHPISHFSKTYSPMECNYEIYNKEFMAIIWTFQAWCPKLQSVINPSSILSDHENLQYFITTKLLNCYQAHWSEFLWQLNFKIVYHPSTTNYTPDILTPRFRDLSEEGDNHSLET